MTLCIYMYKGWGEGGGGKCSVLRSCAFACTHTRVHPSFWNLVFHIKYDGVPDLRLHPLDTPLLIFVGDFTNINILMPIILQFKYITSIDPICLS